MNADPARTPTSALFAKPDYFLSTGSASCSTVPGSGTTGTWIDETGIRPTLMYLAGLKDDYEQDGRVIRS